MNPQFSHITELFEPKVVKALRNQVGRDAAHSEALGKESVEEGDVEAGIVHYRRAVEQAPGDARLARELAGVLAFTDDEEGAEAAWHDALELEDDADARAGLADVLLRQARGREAVEELRAAVGLRPDESRHHARLARVLVERRAPRAAAESYARAIILRPDDAALRAEYAELLQKEGRLDEALAEWKAATDLSPGDDHLYARGAVTLWKSGKRAEAIRSIRLATDLNPENEAYFAMLENLLRLDGQTAEAEKYADDEIDPYDRAVADRFADEIIA